MVNTPSKIDTLVQDIYAVVDKGINVSEELSTEFGQSLSALVTSRLSEERQSGGYLRPSNIGEKCDRKLWYTINAPELAEELPPVVRLKFLLGDVVEQLVLFLAKVAGHNVQGQQDDVSIGGITGSRDAVIDGVVVDVKSASSFSFLKFKNHLTPDQDAFNYLDQLDFYLTASQNDPVVTEKDKAAFLAMDKQMATLALDVHKKQNKDWDQVIKDKQEMLASTKLPDRAFLPEPDGKSGNMKLTTECSYCPFKQACWPGLRTFLYSNGPRYLTHVARTPDVPEVNS